MAGAFTVPDLLQSSADAAYRIAESMDNYLLRSPSSIIAREIWFRRTPSACCSKA
jgi:hypothetical protein